MREQDIRKILQEVCDTIDHHRSKTGAIAVGAALALSVACSSNNAVPAYMAPADTGDSGQVTDSATATDGGIEVSPIDGAVVTYMGPFDSGLDDSGSIAIYSAAMDDAQADSGAVSDTAKQDALGDTPVAVYMAP